MIFENHDLLAESNRFASDEQMIFADIDLDRLVQERMRMTSFSDCAPPIISRTPELFGISDAMPR